jgi:hypothetical protein
MNSKAVKYVGYVGVQRIGKRELRTKYCFESLKRPFDRRTRERY